MSAIEAITEGFNFLATAITLLKRAKDVLPDGEQKYSVEQSLREAEMNSKLAEAQIAQAIRYQLCSCTFPPQIMLSRGYRQNREYFLCRNCGNTWPPPDTGQVEFVEDYNPFGD